MTFAQKKLILWLNVLSGRLVKGPQVRVAKRLAEVGLVTVSLCGSGWVARLTDKGSELRQRLREER